jgi:hypothetical protein
MWKCYKQGLLKCSEGIGEGSINPVLGDWRGLYKETVLEVCLDREQRFVAVENDAWGEGPGPAYVSQL